jgi:ribosomal subunit interface protein
MNTTVTFRHTKGQHPDLNTRALQTAENFEKYIDDIISTNVEFINEANKIVQFQVHVKDNTIVAKHASDDFHKSLTEASEKIIRQLKKWKTKHTNGRV